MGRKLINGKAITLKGGVDNADKYSDHELRPYESIFIANVCC
jgi:hypothetical protein